MTEYKIITHNILHNYYVFCDSLDVLEKGEYYKNQDTGNLKHTGIFSYSNQCINGISVDLSMNSLSQLPALPGGPICLKVHPGHQLPSLPD